jgi:outer membrane protein
MFNLRSSLIVFALASGLPLAPLRAQPTLDVSLPEAWAAVDGASLAVLLSREAVAQAIASAQQSRANLLPNVTLDATQRRARSASIGSTLARTGVSNRFDLGVSGRLEVLDPQNIAAYHAARVGINVAELDLAATRETVLATVANAFFQHQRNLARLDVVDSNIERARALLELAQRQADAGVATQIDVTRAQALLANAEQDRLQQETVVAQSGLQFKRLLGLPMEPVLRLAPFNLTRSEPSPFTALQEELALELRSDYQRARRLLDQNELEVRAAKFNRLPSLAVQGSYGEASEQPFNGNEATVWSAAAALSLPVFDGMRTGALTRLAMSRRRAQELRLRDLEFAISAEVRLAVQNIRSRHAQVDVAEKSLRLAQDELRLAQIRFEQGVADNREIIEAQNRLAQASDNRLEAVHQYHLSRVELERAQGNVRALLEHP